TFTVPGSGASASLAGNPVTISLGQASVTATANGTIGSYSVTAAANGATGTPTFNLTNSETPSLVVTTLSDETSNTDGTTSLREAIAYANSLGGDETITFASSLFTGGAGTITLNAANGELQLTDTTGAITINGPGANTLAVSGNNASRVFEIDSGVTA